MLNLNKIVNILGQSPAYCKSMQSTTLRMIYVTSRAMLSCLTESSLFERRIIFYFFVTPCFSDDLNVKFIISEKSLTHYFVRWFPPILRTFTLSARPALILSLASFFFFFFSERIRASLFANGGCLFRMTRSVACIEDRSGRLLRLRIGVK